VELLPVRLIILKQGGQSPLNTAKSLPIYGMTNHAVR
jgi:hypothetical protein